jgi:sugar lactone lactonase YvrE
MRLFISYAHKNHKVVTDLVAILKRGGHEPWFDEQLKTGLRWQDQLHDAIEDSDGIVLSLTPQWLESEWCQWEFVTAIELGKQIVPVLLEQTDLPVVLSQYQYADFTKGFADEARVERFLGDLSEAAITIPPADAPPAPQEPKGTPAQAGGSTWSLPVVAGLVIGLLTLIVAVIAVLPSLSLGQDADARPTQVLTPTPLPELEVFSSDALQGLILNDVAAANGQVWFATDGGLIHYVEGQSDAERITQLPDGNPLSALAVDSSGDEIWFANGARELLRVGRYLAAQDRLEWYEPPPEIADGLLYINAIQVESDGTAWFGDLAGAIFTRQPDGTWQTIPQPDPPLDSVSAMHLNEASAPTALWVVGSSQGVPTAARWQEDRWLSLSMDEICQEIACNLITVASDAQGRAWIGHSEGITLRSENIGQLRIENCLPGESGLASGITTDSLTTDEGDVLWIVTRGELARLDLTQEAIAQGCGSWQWETWTDFTFWQAAVSVDYRLAASESLDGAALTLWVVELGSNRVRRLVWQE